MKIERKPLAFSTTMRNPDRIAGFLSCVVPFEKQILTNDIINKIIANVLKNKLYKPTKLTNEVRNKFASDELELTDDEIKNIIEQNPQRHKEKGFEYGWPSRFDTWYKLPKEFGFLKYSMNKTIEISETGHMLIEAFNSSVNDNTKIANIMLNSMVKYHTNNPFRRNQNNNVPIILLLKLIDLLKKDNDENNAGVYRQEIPLLVCWPNNDAKQLYELIKNIRKTKKFSYSDEFIYEKCLELLETDKSKSKRFKMNQICGECVDEYIRKMRSTGIISLRGNGRFIDFNTFEIEKIQYVLNNYSSDFKFNTEDEYYDYVSKIDTNIIYIVSTNIKLEEKNTIKNKKLREIANTYTKEQIFNELKILCSKADSKDALFKYISAPTRLEFLISIALMQNYEHINIQPNYSIDDEGLPTFVAKGGVADIECYDDKCDCLYEVSLLCGRQDQVNNEIVPIRRHLIEHKGRNKKVFSIFVAPTIHVDTIEVATWYKHKDNITIIPYNLIDFLKIISSTKEPIEFLQYFATK